MESFLNPATDIALRPVVCVNGAPTLLRDLLPSNAFAPSQLAIAGGFFLWSPTEADADDGATIIKPSDIDPGDPGRWVIVPGPM